MQIQIMIFTQSGKFVGNDTIEMGEVWDCVEGHLQQGNVVILVDEENKEVLMKIIPTH